VVQVTAPRDVLDAHTTLYERLKYPPQEMLSWYGQFFTEKAVRLLQGTASDHLMPWLQMFVPARNEHQFLELIRRPLYGAPTYQVSADIVGAVTSTYEATISRAASLNPADLPSPSGFAWLDVPLVLQDAGGYSITTRAMSWGPQYIAEDFMGGAWPPEGDVAGRDGVRLTSYSHVDDSDSESNRETEIWMRSHGMPLSVSHSAFVPYSLPLHVRDPAADDVTAGDLFRWAHTLWMFMGTEIVTTSRPQVERPARRRAQRSLSSSDVNVVTLWRIRHGDTELSHKDVDWSCRWIVQAHERHLDSPAEGETPHHARVDGPGGCCLTCGRRTTHIRAYVKGPDGMPLRAVPETVYRVAR
jgi:hypothetical protein